MEQIGHCLAIASFHRPPHAFPRWHPQLMDQKVWMYPQVHQVYLLPLSVEFSSLFYQTLFWEAQEQT